PVSSTTIVRCDAGLATRFPYAFLFSFGGLVANELTAACARSRASRRCPNHIPIPTYREFAPKLFDTPSAPTRPHHEPRRTRFPDAVLVPRRSIFRVRTASARAHGAHTDCFRSGVIKFASAAFSLFVA